MLNLFLLLFAGYLAGLLLPLCFPANPRIQNLLAPLVRHPSVALVKPGYHLPYCPDFRSILWYAVTGPVERHIPVDARIPGCPPRPAEILEALSELRKRRA